MNGSYHKLCYGYNSHNGFYDIENVCQGMIDLFSNAYNLELPSFENWYVHRIDISFVYDLENQENVSNYINNCRYLVYPRRKTQYFLNECVYFAGSRSTLKIYNKFLEFKKHDYKKLNKFDNFDIDNYCEQIKGFVRFECELRKKKLYEILGEDKNKVLDIDIEKLNNYVVGDFMKLFKVNDNNICIVRSQNDVKNLLYSRYKDCKARRLFGFYLCCINDGINNVKEQFSSSSFYRNILELKECGIDFTQQAFIVEEKIETNVKFVDFMPFVNNCKYREVV
ncbi:MAG: hypothetical protein IKV94_03505 [Clostridia bacterium]|nr:hypothetical protein [Clostridia bacterium]